MEKEAREAILSVVATLPNIDELKPEQEEALLSFVGGHDARNIVSGRSWHMTYVTTKRYCDWLWQIQSGTGQIQ